MKKYSDVTLWKDVSENEWTDWKWQLSHCITSLDQLQKVITLTPEEITGVKEATKSLKMRISPHIAFMMVNGDENDTLRRQFIPSLNEVRTANMNELFSDVNDDDNYSPIPGLVHRYPTKVLVFPSNYCACYCRYCFRRKLNRDVETTLKKDDFYKIFEYLKNHPQINEVIFSGGDPLVIEDETIQYLLENLASISTVTIIRFHTRMIITNPFRISDNLISLLNKFKSRFAIYIVIHIDTIRELSFESKKAISQLVDNGIMCLASCPLLHNINDDESTLKTLWNGLVQNRIKPYYLFQSDPVQGLGHFIVPLSRGLEITRNLYDNMSGLAMPLYCFNVPNGGGHILISYPYIKRVDEHKFELTNFEGKVTLYTEPIWNDNSNQ